MTHSQVITLLIFISLMTTEAQADQRYKGMSVGYENFKEFTHTANDPFVEKNTVSVTGLWGYQKQGNLTLNYEGEVSLGMGTHQSAKIFQTQKTTQDNYILATMHRVSLSKRLHQFEPEVGMNAAATLAKVNHRIQLKTNAMIGLGYYPNADTKLGVRIEKALSHQYFYKEFTLVQNDSMTYHAYAEKQVKHTIQGISLGFQQAKQGDPKPYKTFIVREPDNKAVMITLYKKY